MSHLATVMIRTVALLCLVAPAFGFLGLFPKWEPNLKVTFEINPLVPSFMEQPRTIAAAEKENYVKVTRPESHDGYSSLVMYCQQCEYAVCLLYDPLTGDIAGIQFSVNVKQVSDVVYDWKIQGSTLWTIGINGQTENFWSTQIYFDSAEYLKTDPNTRIAARDSTKLLQGPYIYVSSYNGELYAISTNATDITNPETSDFTEQACIPFMGHHYYYKMTKNTECNDKLFKYFPLIYADRLIGFGTMLFIGNYTYKDHCTKYIEQPPQLAVKTIVNNGPQCLYNLAKSPGIYTIHTYFYDNVNDILCLD